MSSTKSKIQILIIISTVLVILNLGLMAYIFFMGKPQPKIRPPFEIEFKKNQPKKIISERLNLNGQQIDQYENLIKEHKANIQLLDDSIRAAKKSLFLLLAPQDKFKADSVIMKIVKFQTEIEQNHYDHFVGLRKLCDVDQIKAFDKLTEEMAIIFAPPKHGPPLPKQ